MTIDKIFIKSFGQLTNMTLDFSSNVNVIEGQNEAGKSTIAAFIKYMLFGFDTNDEEGALTERRKRINWDSGTAEGSMYVTVKGRKYLITRSTATVDNGGRISYKEDASIIDLESGTPAFGKLPAGEVFFGVDRELFENTAFIGQLGDASIKEGSVKGAIENILFSGNEKINTQRAINHIREKMEALLHTGGTGGAIFDLIKQQEELEAKLKKTDEDNKQILAKEAELHEIKARRDEAETKRAHLLELDQCYCNFMLIQSFDKLHELEERSAKQTEEYNAFLEKNTRNGYIPDAEYLTKLAVSRKNVDDSYKRARDAAADYEKAKSAVGITKEIEGSIALSDSLGGENKIFDKTATLAVNKIKCLAGGIFALLAFLASVVVMIAAPLDGAPAARVALGVLAALALGGAGFLAFVFMKNLTEERSLCSKFSAEGVAELKGKLAIIREAREKRDGITSKTENAKEALERASAELDEAKMRLAEIVGMWCEVEATHDINAFLNTLERDVRVFLDEKSKLALAKDTIEITVKEIRRTLQDKSEIDIRAQVSPLKRKILVEIKHDEIIGGIAEAKAIIDEQQRLAFNVESELTSLKLRARDPGELYSKIQALDAKIARLEAKHKAYFVALRALESASDNLRSEVSPRLAAHAAEFTELMTEKYSNLGIDENLKVSFKTKSGSDKSIDYLSGGTRDLTYLALRFSLIDMLYTEKPPIAFDETFANQDNDRARALMKAIRKLADEDYQSFIFTCRQREATLALEEAPDAGIYRLSVKEA